jgi:hypothetical protein
VTPSPDPIDTDDDADRTDTDDDAGSSDDDLSAAIDTDDDAAAAPPVYPTIGFATISVNDTPSDPDQPPFNAAGLNPYVNVGTTSLWDQDAAYNVGNQVVFNGYAFSADQPSQGQQPYIGSPDWDYIPGGTGDNDISTNQNCNNPPGAPAPCTPPNLEYVLESWPSGPTWALQVIS